MGWDLIRKRLVTWKDKEGRGIAGKTPMERERRGEKEVKIVKVPAGRMR